MSPTTISSLVLCGTAAWSSLSVAEVYPGWVVVQGPGRVVQVHDPGPVHTTPGQAILPSCHDPSDQAPRLLAQAHVSLLVPGRSHY